MLDWYILNDQGKPVLEPDYLKAARWMKDHQTRLHVGDTDVDGVRVSTVFLGLDHSWHGRRPVLWETMVFGGELDGEQERYTSRAAAEAGHATMVERVRKHAGKKVDLVGGE